MIGTGTEADAAPGQLKLTPHSFGHEFGAMGDLLKNRETWNSSEWGVEIADAAGPWRRSRTRRS
jgi:hypothetical protein